MTHTLIPLQKSTLRRPANDVDLTAFNLEMRNKAGIHLVSAITDAVIDETIDGASTLTVTVDDDNARTIQRSGRLGRKVDVKVDGLWWTLVAVKKTGRQLTLTFEEREVNVLRYYSKFIKANRSQVTRAQFVLRMIKEVKEIPLKWYIPELTVKQPISDVQPGQILVNQALQPVTTPDPASQVMAVPVGSKLTVKGEPANADQMKNANMILQKGVEMGASRKVMVSSIMTAIDESVLTNLVGGDRDSVGVFQQRRSMGWPATRDVPTDAAAYLKEAIALDRQQPNLAIQLLCQGVQRSADSTGSNYARFQNEAEQWVTAFGMSKSSLKVEKGNGGSVIGENNQTSPPTTPGATGNLFIRGTITVKSGSSNGLLTKENSWNCMTRLAREVDWRCFCSKGVIWFVSDKWLFKSKPYLRISEDVLGIDAIDYDYDEGKRQATVTVTAHISRWSAPAGSIIEIFDMGIVNGKWLVSDISRSLFDSIATITLIKPSPILPEPTSLSNIPAGFGEPPAPQGERNNKGTATSPNQTSAKVVAYARSQMGLPYQWGAEEPGVAFDCSGLTQAAYQSAGISIPRVAADQYKAGPIVPSGSILLAGDLVFFGSSPDTIHHVGIYVGNGAMIDAPHTGSFVRIDDNFQTSWSDYYGATRPWQLSKT